MEGKVDIKGIKQALDHNKRLVVEPHKRGGYIVTEGGWGTYNSRLEDFGQTFDQVLPKNFKSRFTERFQDYIETVLAQSIEKAHDLVGVEFGGPGSKLFHDFSPGFFKKTLGICLKDIRTKDEIAEDNKNGHSVINADLLDTTQYNKLLTNIVENLSVNKIDLIISRMEGPLGFIDKHPAILDRIVRNWYSLLRENGIMFIQYGIPEYQLPLDTHEEIQEPMAPIEDEVGRWSTALKNKFPNMDIQISNKAIRIRKNEGSPRELPPATQLFN